MKGHAGVASQCSISGCLSVTPSSLLFCPCGGFLWFYATRDGPQWLNGKVAQKLWLSHTLYPCLQRATLDCAPGDQRTAPSPAAGDQWAFQEPEEPGSEVLEGEEQASARTEIRESSLGFITKQSAPNMVDSQEETLI